MEYLIVDDPDTEHELIIGHVCSKGCAKRIGAYVNWKQEF